MSNNYNNSNNNSNRNYSQQGRGRGRQAPYNNNSGGRGDPVTNPRAILLASASVPSTKPSLPLPGFGTTTLPPQPGESIDISKSTITSTIGDGKYIPPAILLTKQGVTAPEAPIFKLTPSTNQKPHYGHQNQGSQNQGNQNQGNQNQGNYNQGRQNQGHSQNGQQHGQQRGQQQQHGQQGGNWASTVERNKSVNHGGGGNKKRYGLTWNEHEEQKKNTTTSSMASLSLKDDKEDIGPETTTKEAEKSVPVDDSTDVQKARLERHIVRSTQLETIIHNEFRNITRKSDSVYKELCLNGLKTGAPNLYASVSELSNIYIDYLVTCPALSLESNFASKFVALRNSVLDLYLNVFGSQNISDSIDVSSPQNTAQTIKTFLAELNSYADSLANIIVGLRAAPDASVTIRELLVVLGDIAVYAEKYRLDTRSQIDWTFAMTYYGEAAAMMPVNGLVLKSFSSISQIDGNNFETAYLLFRSMQTTEPYQAREPLLSVFDEVKLRSEKGVDTSANFNNFTFQEHRMKFKSSFLVSIGIAFSRVDNDKYTTYVEKCRKHLEAMMSILSVEVNKTKSNSSNDGTQIFESEKTVASLTETGTSNIFKYISILDEETFKCMIMCLSLIQNIIDKNPLGTRISAARFINVSGDDDSNVDGIVDKFLVQFLHSIKCIQGLVEVTQLIMMLVSNMIGTIDVGLHTVAATSRAVSTFLRWLQKNHELSLFSLIDKVKWEAMEKSLGLYLSAMNTSTAVSTHIQEDHDLCSFTPLKDTTKDSLVYSNNNYLCPWGASRGFALDYKSVVTRAARCEAVVKQLSTTDLIIGSTIGRVGFNLSKVGIPYVLSERSLVSPKDLVVDRLKMLMVSYQPSTAEDTLLLSSSRAASSTAARLVTSSSSSSTSSNNKPRGGRPLVVLDSSALAKYRGDSMPASCRGIKQAIQYYLNGGHKVITFLPSAFLRSDKLAELNRLTKLKIGEQSHCEVPNDINMLNDFIRDGVVKGVTVNEYVEAYCLVYARKNDAILVSTDNFREHVKKIEGMQEREEVRAWIRTSTIGYQFQGDYFKPQPIP